MIHRVFIHISVVVISLSISLAERAHAPKGTALEQRIKKIDTWLEKLHAKNKFNGGILIAQQGKPLLMKTYGFKDHQKTSPLTTKTPFRLASVSKHFTAAGILILVEEDKVKLDDLVSKYLRGFPYEGVTVRHLLNQTSGVPDNYMDLASEYSDQVGETLSTQEAVHLVCMYSEKRDAEPNEEYAYSNTNYVLLAGIVERVSGMSFESFMRKKLFSPLGMKQTRVWNLSSPTSFDERAEDIDSQTQPWTEVDPDYLDGVAGDGAVFASLEDFLIWDGFWKENKLLSKPLLSEVFKRPTLNDGSRSEYSCGWVIEAESYHWHDGAWLAANTYLARYPKKEGVIVILDNSSNPEMSEGNISTSVEKLLEPFFSTGE